MKILLTFYLVLVSLLVSAVDELNSSTTVPNGLSQQEWLSVKQQMRVKHPNSSMFSTEGSSYLLQHSYIKASNTDDGDLFGTSVAISGDTMVVGALYEDSLDIDDQSDESGSFVGAAYVFVKTAGTWQQEAYLKSEYPGSFDYFGNAVAISDSGDAIVIGATGEDSSSTGVNNEADDNSLSDSGAAYLFIYESGVWSQEAYFKASNTGGSDRFGSHVDISGNTIVIGSIGEDTEATDAGAAYVFTQSEGDGEWSQQAMLTASNAGFEDNFGNSIAISDETIVVGAHNEDSINVGTTGSGADDDAEDAGAAYVFTRDSGAWTEEAYLKASNTDAGDEFGYSVAINTDTILIGSPFEDSASLVIDEGDDSNAATSAGAAYVFTRSGTSWAQQGYIKAPNAESTDYLGRHVAIDSDTIIVGAKGEDSASTDVNGNQGNNDEPGSGAAYIFTREDETWSFYEYLKASNTESSDAFGSAVAISGDTYVVGADREDSQATGVNSNLEDNNDYSASGAVYAFTSYYDISGSITGLVDSQSVTLQLNGGYEETFTSTSSSVTLFEELENSSPYNIVVSSQPTDPDTLCIVTGGDNDDGTGVVDGGDVTDIAINCSGITYSLGGTITGLAPGNTVALQNNSGDDLTISSNGLLTFDIELSAGDTYEVTVLTQPTTPNQVCTVVNGDGEVEEDDISDVEIACLTTRYQIDVTVTGLPSSDSIVLQNNATDNLTITADGSYTFASIIPDERTYDVTIFTQPNDTDYSCSVSNGSGTVSGTDVTDITITCTGITYYSLGGTITGLAPGNTVVLQNNSGDDLTISSNGLLTFDTELSAGDTYEVTVLTQPTTPNQVCTVVNGDGEVEEDDISDVEIACLTTRYQIDVTVTGLPSSDSIVLQNNATDNLTITADGSYTFASIIPDERTYDVTIFTQPNDTDYSCSVSNGSGTVSGTDVTDITIECTDVIFTTGFE